MRFWFLFLLLLLCSPLSARAQTAVILQCYNSATPINPWVPCANPLPVAVGPGTSGVTYSSSSALAANQVLKATPGVLYDFNVSADATLSAAAWWIMIYDAASAPGDGAVTPAKCYAMPSGATSYSAAFPTPMAATAGIVIGVSTTGCFTKTASTHAFISGDYK